MDALARSPLASMRVGARLALAVAAVLASLARASPDAGTVAAGTLAAEIADVGASSSESSIRVQVGTGNERAGSILEFPQEVRQCVHDIVSWYERQHAKGGDVRDLGLRFASADGAAVRTLRDAYAPGLDLPDPLQMLFTKCLSV